MQQHPDAKEFVQIIGELLGKSGAGDAVEALINQIISTINSKPADWQRTTEVLCSKLAVFIPAGVDDPKRAFGKVPELCNALALVVASERGDVQLITSVSLVSRRLADKFENDAISPFGLKAFEPKLTQSIAAALVGDAKAKQNRNFLINGYRTMAVVAHDKATNGSAIAASAATGLIPESFEMMRSSANDPDVVARILEFLANLSSSPEGAKAVRAGYKSGDEQVSL